jgi:ferritin-like protein
MGTEWHAPYELLKPETQDMARALNSLQEELEAMDWYNQRIDVTHDEELRGILAHNRDEEKEHAAMVLEWIRRHDPVWDAHLRTYLFTTSDILVEEAQKQVPDEGGGDRRETPAAPISSTARQDIARPSLTVGSLRSNRLR